jgi:hypothetical protein
VPTLALHGINGDSAGNYHLMDEESIGGMIILPGIHEPPEDYLFLRELPDQGQGIHWRNEIPLGITSS